jgi:ABC-type nitrate/sulfonate/bicarbonate transport system substrate-binding protein
MKRVVVLALVCLLAVAGLAVLAGCGSTTTTTAAPVTTAPPATTATTAPPATTATTAPPATTATTAGVKLPKLSPEVTVSVAFDDAPGTAGLILADQLGYFKEVGINISWVKFNSGADMYTALAANKVDVGRGIITASLFNGAAQGVKVWVVADSGTNVPGKPGFFTLVMAKSQEGKINDYADLKGKKCIIASKGSINELFLARALAKANLKLSDVTEVIIDSFPDINTALGNGAGDVGMQIESLITAGVDQGIIVRFPKDAQDFAPNEQVACLLYSDAFAKNKAVADAFMVAHLLGVRAYNDGVVQGDKDRAKVLDILTKKTFISDAAMWTKMGPTGVNPDGTVLSDAVAFDQDFYAGLGLVPTKVDMKDVVDQTFAQDAVKILGAYTPPK